MAEKRRLGKGSNDTVGYNPPANVIKQPEPETPKSTPPTDGKMVSVRLDGELLDYYAKLTKLNRSNLSSEIRRILAEHMRSHPLR